MSNKRMKGNAAKVTSKSVTLAGSPSVKGNLLRVVLNQSWVSQATANVVSAAAKASRTLKTYLFYGPYPSA